MKERGRSLFVADDPEVVGGPGPQLRCVGWGWRGRAGNNKAQGCWREGELEDSEFVLVGCTLFALASCIVTVAIWRLHPFGPTA